MPSPFAPSYLPSRTATQFVSFVMNQSKFARQPRLKAPQQNGVCRALRTARLSVSKKPGSALTRAAILATRPLVSFSASGEFRGWRSKSRAHRDTHPAPKATERAKHAIPFQNQDQNQCQTQSLGSHWLTKAALRGLDRVSSM